MPTWEVGFDADNRICALRATLTSDGGWSLDLSEPVLARALCHIDNAYWIPNIEVHGRIAKTNKTLADRVPRVRRAAGHDRHRGHPRPLRPAARGRRRRSCGAATSTRPGQTTPYGQPVRHAERLADDLVDPRRERSDFAAPARPRSPRSTPRTRTPSAALAMTPVKFGISFNLTAFNQAGALVHVYKDGSVLINHGGAEMGQGLHTKMIQVAATALGRAAGLRPAGPDPDRQGAQHLGHRGELRRRPQRRRGQERLRPDPGAAERGRGRQARHPPRRRALRRRRGHRHRLPRQADQPGPSWCTTPTSSGCSCGRPASTGPRGCTGTPTGCRASRSSTSPTARRCPRSRWTASPAPTGCCAPTSCTTSATACPR